MINEKKVVPLEEAINEVEAAITRLALMHLSFSKTLIEELGEETGTELIIKSIIEYGRRIALRVNAGKSDLPKWGVYSGDVYQDEEGYYVVTGCNLAKVFKEYNELHLGRFYCYVDAAKSMAADPLKKLIHTTCEACGDDRCTLALVSTTEKEREHFINENIEKWKDVDPRLV
ncbi:MAG: L-2-amino-thiazoline-4-carboxylic acid hydrolase [Candidatus Hodarchaeota archaeon]